MTYMVDTNICIYAIKNKPEQVLKQLHRHKAFLPIIMELWEYIVLEIGW